jgi:Na+:H+ antiporter, NhaA family
MARREDWSAGGSPLSVHPLPPTGSRLSRAARAFLETEAAGGIVLMAAASAALIWANSPWHGSYEELWHTELAVKVGTVGIAEDLRHWVNDALMALFFFVVGLEVKRELVTGELRRWRTAAVPVVAALGGMVVPAIVYTAFNYGRPGAGGWGIPMATDIAFALGVLALVGRRAHPGVKLFLLTLAVADDIGAIVVIAVFYANDLQPAWLLAAAGLVAALVVMRRSGVRALGP